MELTLSEAGRLKELIKNDFPELSDEIQKAMDRHEINIGKLKEIKHCKHRWHVPTKMELRLHGSPSMHGIADKSPEFIEEYYMVLASYCEDCGLRYSDSLVNIDEAVKVHEEDFRIFIEIGATDYRETIGRVKKLSENS